MITPQNRQRRDEFRDEIHRRALRGLPIVVTVAVLFALAVAAAVSLQRPSTEGAVPVVADKLDDKVESDGDGVDGPAAGQEPTGSSRAVLSDADAQDTPPAGPDVAEDDATGTDKSDGRPSTGESDAAPDGGTATTGETSQAETASADDGDNPSSETTPPTTAGGDDGTKPRADQPGNSLGSRTDTTTDTTSNGPAGSGADTTPPTTEKKPDVSGGGGTPAPTTTKPTSELIPPDKCLPDEGCLRPCDGPACSGIGIGGTEPLPEPEPCPIGNCQCDPEIDPNCDPIDDDTPTCLPGQLPPCDDSGTDPECLLGQLPPCFGVGPGPDCLPGQLQPCDGTPPVCLPPLCDSPIDRFPLPDRDSPIDRFPLPDRDSPIDRFPLPDRDSPIDRVLPPIERIVPVEPELLTETIDLESGVLPGLQPGQE